jgi:hypothetical protein
MQKIAHYVFVKISNPDKFAGQTQAGGKESQRKYLISIRNERRLPEFHKISKKFSTTHLLNNFRGLDAKDQERCQST